MFVDPVWCLGRPCQRVALDIEDMTANTGNVKKFSVFVNMLWAALRGSTDSVFVDLLTASDLESLRSRTAGPQSNGRPGFSHVVSHAPAGTGR